MSGRVSRRAARERLRCPGCHSVNVRRAWGPAAMLGLGVLCLVAAVVVGLLVLRAGGGSTMLVSLILLGGGVVTLVRWNSYRGRTYFRCRTCGRMWARVRED